MMTCLEWFGLGPTRQGLHLAASEGSSGGKSVTDVKNFLDLHYCAFLADL
jgi:hypothetical protein